MSDLPEVRRADCGHGFLPIDTPPAARTQNGMHEQPVYLCEACRAQLQRPKVETKDVKPEAQPKATAETKAVEAPAELPAAKDDPYWQGRKARTKGVNQAGNPYDGRSKQGRQWQRGWAEGAEK